MLLTSNPILNKALEGQRITSAEALELFENADLLELAYVANEKRRKLHPDNEAVTYVVQRNINYSNVCTASCSFCAFYTYPGVDDKSNPAYTLDYETQIKPKISELVAINGTEILLQGGHNPELGLDYYQELFISIKKDFPSVTLHALSPSEINHIAEKYFTSVSAYGDGTKMADIKEPNLEEIKIVLLALKEAGMDSLPGAGAEILTERVRLIIAPKKINSQRWLDIMEVAHGVGFKSSATMMYGHVETYEDRVEHLTALRDLQDRTNGFTAFVLWNFQRGDTPLGKIMNAYERDGKLPKYNKDSSGEEYLRSLAVSRIFLDNFKNFQASWVTQGHEIGQLSLNFGCNDLGGNMMEENVVSAANTTYRTSVQQMEYFIEACGREAMQRDTQYNLVNF
ncbi:MAG: radical SAM protein [Candidatus Melainabacteria bacterium]|jgi:cyclic dehypoxanthinyl futalosine synthase|nr:radical SAM protein [Candidatus Melainabacteria bacterium]